LFPEFNSYSTPLLIMMVIGSVFAILLLGRYFQKRKHADLLLVIILALMIYDRTTYTIGFMGWYDTFKNTNVNYFLWPMGMAIGPLVYLYVRTTIEAPFRLRKVDYWHFVPAIVYIIYKIVLIIHDAQQEDWGQGYSGGWKAQFDETYVSDVRAFLAYTSKMIYAIVTVQIFARYRKKVKEYFSNTYKVELNWILIFLVVYLSLFVYGTLAELLDLSDIVHMGYTDFWWVNLAYSLAVVLLGYKAYRVDLASLHMLTWDIPQEVKGVFVGDTDIYDDGLKTIKSVILDSSAHLNPDLTLKEVSQISEMSIHEVSEHINKGLGINFSEYINRYRVDEVKKALLDPDSSHLSLVAIAMDSGFNSKATFNRVFKKITGQSPSDYRSQHTS